MAACIRQSEGMLVDLNALGLMIRKPLQFFHASLGFFLLQNEQLEKVPKKIERMIKAMYVWDDTYKRYFYRYKFQLFQTAVSDSYSTLVRLGSGLGETHWNSIATWFWGTSISGPCQNVKCWFGIMVSYPLIVWSHLYCWIVCWYHYV